MGSVRSTMTWRTFLALNLYPLCADPARHLMTAADTRSTVDVVDDLGDTVACLSCAQGNVDAFFKLVVLRAVNGADGEKVASSTITRPSISFFFAAWK